jgi:hypothetical protein
MKTSNTSLLISLHAFRRNKLSLAIRIVGLGSFSIDESYFSELSELYLLLKRFISGFAYIVVRQAYLSFSLKLLRVSIIINDVFRDHTGGAKRYSEFSASSKLRLNPD